MQENAFSLIFLSFIAGCILTAGSFVILYRLKMHSYRSLATQIIKRGETEAAALKDSATIAIVSKQLEYQQELDRRFYSERTKIQKEEEHIKKREDKFEMRLQVFEKKLSDVGKREKKIAVEQDLLQQKCLLNDQLQQELQKQLQNVSGLSAQQAKEILLERITNQVQIDAANVIRRSTAEASEQAQKEACKIIATAINRMAVPCMNETVVSTITLPNDEVKGRIIGREGRNIRALEHATGVNIIIDETPRALVLSGFDPIRKQIAKEALQMLVQDGRIHPGSIEESVEKAKKSIQKQIKEYGEQAAVQVGVAGLHIELIQLLGKLKFRYSYRQNILDHSIEVSQIMGLMAAELGLDVLLAKRIGLLHDVGKAVSHEIEGSHAIIGHDLAKKYGESILIANGIGCHHQEMTPSTIEASLCSAADAISAARPGVRAENVELYFKRLQQLEKLAKSFHGVEEAYVMQAGREVRAYVSPDRIDDDGVLEIAYGLSKKIQQDLRYPGKIKVMVIREKRVIEYAV